LQIAKHQNFTFNFAELQLRVTKKISMPATLFHTMAAYSSPQATNATPTHAGPSPHDVLFNTVEENNKQQPSSSSSIVNTRRAKTHGAKTAANAMNEHHHHHRSKPVSLLERIRAKTTSVELTATTTTSVDEENTAAAGGGDAGAETSRAKKESTPVVERSQTIDQQTAPSFFGKITRRLRELGLRRKSLH